MFQHVPGAGKVPEKLVMGGSDKKNRLPVFGFLFKIVQNRPGNRSRQFLVMFRSDTGSDTDTGFRYFSGFSRKSSAESIGMQKKRKISDGRFRYRFR